ncbi:MAG: hypothetical protein N2Z70_05695 [Bdellovibrionaceae bacterium]|nr:hypothetical protein [Pseudobdellovibrionaceae bacterium]
MFIHSVFWSWMMGTTFMLSSAALAGSIQLAGSQRKPQTRPAKVVFIPGYYGSFLHDAKTGERVFLTSHEYFFPSGRLMLPCANPEAPESLVVGGIFDALRVLGSWWKISAYDRALELIRKESGTEPLVFTYDWRLDPLRILQRFEQFWREHELEGENVHLVAHSYGALIAFYWLWYGLQNPSEASWNPSNTSRLSSALLVTPPLHGSLAIFRNMLWGTPGTVSPRLLGAEIVSSFPAAYFLTPNEGEFVVQGQLKTFPLKKAETWKTQGWGAWQWPERMSRECEATLTRYLVESKAFYEKLAGPVDLNSAQKLGSEESAAKGDDLKLLQDSGDLKTNPSLNKKVTVVIATGHETLDRGFWHEPRPRFKAQWRGERNSQLMVDGDGTLSTRSQTPHSWFIQQGWIETRRIKGEHLDALTHPELRGIYRQWRSP